MRKLTVALVLTGALLPGSREGLGRRAVEMSHSR
jgi:hypothetical protein